MNDEAWAATQDVWPGIELSRETFAQFLESRSTPDTAEGLAELYLACACIEGDRVALTSVDTRYVHIVPQAISHMKLPSALVDEIQQQVRTKLLVGTEQRPACLADYAGQGKLRGLVKVMAVRMAISELRKEKPQASNNEDVLRDMASPVLDPELQVMKARYRAEFSKAFEESIASLSSRDRNILRLHLVDGLTVDQVGSFYRVHRATATRWLAKVRSDLLRETRKRMQGALQVDGSELDSVMRLIQSRLDVSVQRMLETRDR